MPFGRPHQFPTSFERGQGYADGVFTTRNSQRDRCTAFKKVSVSTAICDVCNNRNSTGIMRCYDCGWQTCMQCARARQVPAIDIAQCITEGDRDAAVAVRANGSSTSNGVNDSGSSFDSASDNSDSNSNSDLGGALRPGRRGSGHHDESESVLGAANALMTINRESMNILQWIQDDATLSMPSQGTSSDTGRQQKRVPINSLLLLPPQKVHFDPKDCQWYPDELAFWNLVHVACVERDRPGYDRATIQRDTDAVVPTAASMQPLHTIQNPSSPTAGVQLMNDISSGQSGSVSGNSNDNAQSSKHQQANALVGCWLETQLNKNLHGDGRR